MKKHKTDKTGWKKDQYKNMSTESSFSKPKVDVDMTATKPFNCGTL